jgi:hypothetical protein
MMLANRGPGDFIADEKQHRLEKIRQSSAGSLAAAKPPCQRHEDHDHQNGDQQLDQHEPSNVEVHPRRRLRNVNRAAA